MLYRIKKEHLELMLIFHDINRDLKIDVNESNGGKINNLKIKN